MKLFICLLILPLTILFSRGASAHVRHTIVVNKWNNTLKYYETGKPAREFRVATGKYKCTPEGTFKIVQRTHISNTGRGEYGTRWLGLNTLGQRGWYHIGIHGTNQPSSIGKYASAACVRMHNKDVNWLFDHAPYGTTVRIVNIPITHRPSAKEVLKKLAKLVRPLPSPTRLFGIRYSGRNALPTVRNNTRLETRDAKMFDVKSRVASIQQSQQQGILLTSLYSGYVSFASDAPVLRKYF